MTLLTTSAALKEFCASLAHEAFIAIDTEFMREKTYYAQLCLVQIAGKESAAAIDPLSQGIDLTPLFELISNPTILKVFHAARQDVEIFVDLTGRVPEPLFDTQVAAMVCGFGEAASYETLARTLAGATIDKSSRFTDWARRPLSHAQISYALSDVVPLRIVYEALAARLDSTGRESWMADEMHVLTRLGTYKTASGDSWKRLKPRFDKPRQLAVLREIAAWREDAARKANVPRSRIVKDEVLLRIAQNPPLNAEELSCMRGLPEGWLKSRQAEGFEQALARGLACAEQEPKKAFLRGKAVPSSRKTEALEELFKVLLRHTSEKTGVAARLIASSDDLARLAQEDAPDIKALTGWRHELFGQAAVSLKKGESALAVENGEVVVVKRPVYKVFSPPLREEAKEVS